MVGTNLKDALLHIITIHVGSKFPQASNPDTLSRDNPLIFPSNLLVSADISFIFNSLNSLKDGAGGSIAISGRFGYN